MNNRRFFLLSVVFLVIISNKTLVADEFIYDVYAKGDQGKPLSLQLTEDELGRIIELYTFYINNEGKKVTHGIHVKYNHTTSMRTQTIYQNGRMLETKSQYVISDPTDLLDKKPLKSGRKK